MYYKQPIPIGTLTEELGEYHFELCVNQDGWELNLIDTNSEELVAKWAFDGASLTDEDIATEGQYGEGVVYNILSSIGYDVRWEFRS